MDNPLLAPSALDITPGEELREKQELLHSDTPTLLQLRRQDIEARRQLEQVNSHELNLEAVAQLNQNLTRLINLVADPDVAERVADSISSGKEYAEFAKGVTALVDMRDRLMDKCVDETASTGKKKRILAQFQGQGVKMVVGVETEG